MNIQWNAGKNKLLKETRGISFEQVKAEIEAGRFVGPENNPAHEGQKLVIVKINDYPVAVPLVIDADGGWFLKTAFFCRKYKRRM